MLARKKLLDLRDEFPRLRKTGKIFDTPLFGLVVAYSSSSQSAQCAFVVSKKISLKSVVRHEVKRKLSDAVGEFLPNIVKSAELLFLAKQKAIEANPEEIKKEMETVLRRSRLLSTPDLQAPKK